MKDTVGMGAHMWLLLRPEFDKAMKEAGFTEHNQRAQVWAAYLAAASGSMVADLGKRDAITVLDGVTAATRETPHLMEVPKQ